MNVTSVDGTSQMNSAPQCTCTPDPDGQANTDGCVLHDLPLSGLLIGEEN